jgi:hypothetical protein
MNATNLDAVVEQVRARRAAEPASLSSSPLWPSR